MLTSYGYIGLFLVVAVLFTIFLLALPAILRLLRITPRHPSAVKGEPFECGMETIGRTWVQFNFRYYLYALVFLALDIVVVFLYLWAPMAIELGSGGFVGVSVLIFLALVGYIYAWRKGALEWQ